MLQSQCPTIFWGYPLWKDIDSGLGELQRIYKHNYCGKIINGSMGAGTL